MLFIYLERFHWRKPFVYLFLFFFFFSKWLLTRRSFLLRGGNSCPLSPLCVETMSVLNLSTSCACCCNLCEFVCVSVVLGLENTSFGMLLSLLSGYSSTELPESWGKGLLEKSYLGVSTLRPLTLCTSSSCRSLQEEGND